MASLKEIKGRISSVKSTQKITSAMKMVSSAKLRKAQYQIERFLPYQRHLSDILESFLAADTEFSTPLSTERPVQSVAIVVFSSNSTLCGAFNSNVIKLLWGAIDRYAQLPAGNIHIYPVGKKVEEALLKADIQPGGSYIGLMDKPAFEGAQVIADKLIADFLDKKIDKVELIYNHFKSTAVQLPTVETFLPLKLEPAVNATGHVETAVDYIVEPDKRTVLSLLIPKSLRMKMYATLLDSAAAEQAARTVAMQIATDNADDILDELTIQFNKQRQQAITSELLDIIGGSEALK
jgi:F-type H+-transporting ATPase subunit gamma